ncbi:EAL domain-containing protein [Paraburkholderia susongensis]|uniref:EAL domain, c-di-GMP-specific phosphodiesterase class I (Or its enzymatically inactive variant) n=1 Tax=Paraburkholderia susongensis TaxID=1515439 RepID=A0A1X7I5A3_9BURK|nr:EAL domain-containing protein [Paraburkholderia susongensis]SMG09032.1 EAL domain, c-di-GMP-specific phosphodiesterase class I (or its enzymatically inactive variant) [Paraburkholderia susongensis]
MTFEEQFLQSVRPVANLPDRPDPAGALCIVASIENLPEIDRAWGSRSALAVRHVVLERARALCRSVPGIAVLSGDLILFVFDSPLGGLPAATSGSTQIGFLLDRILGDLADQPVEIAGDVVFVALSLSVVEQKERAFDIAIADAGSSVARLGQEEQCWRDRFFSDMKAAGRLFSDDGLDCRDFDAELVCTLRNAEVIRYYEMVPFWMSHGVRRPVAEMVAPLERLGLIRRLDRWAVEATVCALQLNPGLSLGCNVTSRSASLDVWWTFILAVLGEQRAVAERLVIELSGVAPPVDLDRVGAFVRRLQALGCQVALDNVGGGGSSVEALAWLGADIVKIDAGCLREARGSDRASDFLRNLVTLARGAGADVVIMGVENEADLEIVEFAGATHIQGPCFPKDALADININSPH